MKRSGFSMIELVFVIVILGVLAAVAVPRFVATRTDAQVATARSDMASAQKAVVAKVFADNIDVSQAKAPNPNMAVRDQNTANFSLTWGEWIIEIAGLDKGRWSTGANVANVGKVNVTGVTDSIANTVTGGVLTATNNDSVVALGNVNNGQQTGYGSCGAIMGIGTATIAGNKIGMLAFVPNNLVDNAGAFCTNLKKSYVAGADKGNKLIPLTSSGTIEF